MQPPGPRPPPPPATRPHTLGTHSRNATAGCSGPLGFLPTDNAEENMPFADAPREGGGGLPPAATSSARSWE